MYFRPQQTETFYNPIRIAVQKPNCNTRMYKIAVIPADGIGPEVINAGVEVLQALAAKLNLSFEFKNYDWDSARFKQTGQYIPDGGLEELKQHDAILFGAVGAPGMSTTIQGGGGAYMENEN